MCAKRCNASDVSGGGGRVSSAQATILPYTLKRGFFMFIRRCNASDVSGGGGRVSSAQATVLGFAYACLYGYVWAGRLFL